MNQIKQIVIAGALALGLGLVSLSHAAPAPKEGNIARGAKAWGEVCTRCHNVRGPGEFRDDQWRPIITHMRIRAGLTGQQTRDILKFMQESN